MSLNVLKKAMLSALLLASSSAFAAQITVDINDIDSYGVFRSPENTVLNFNIGANSYITGVSYSLNLTAFSPSWASEMAFAFTNSKVTEGVLINPAFIYDVPGTGTFADTLDLISEDLDFYVGADGILRLEFYEDYNDPRVSPDGRWNFGTITFEYTPEEVAGEVPEPATALLLGGGAMLMGYAGRRRRAAKAPEAATA
ncbi:MAG: PEP-CTERM sorting domain-containing protein [Pseudomonadota bacterium]